MAEEPDSIRSLLESAVAGEDSPAPTPDLPELDAPALDAPAETPPPADGRTRDEMGRFVPKAEDKPKDTRSRRSR